MASASVALNSSSSNCNAVNELLCAVQFFFQQFDKDYVVKHLSDFYSSEEILTSKNVLFTVAKGAGLDPAPQQVSRRGANKRYADMDGIVSLYAVLDAKKVAPTFAATNLARLPPITSRSVPSSQSASSPVETPAIAALKLSVQDLHVQMAAVLKKLDDIDTRRMQQLPSPPVSSVGTVPKVVISSNEPGPSTVGQSRPTWAEQAANLSAADEPFKPSVTMHRKIMCGTRSASGPVKGVPRPLVCFVGRLNIDTTEDDLRDYLDSVGIHDAICKKLSSRDGKTFKTAAFRVACRLEFRDLFYDESVWPDGCEVRDWYVRANNNGQR